MTCFRYRERKEGRDREKERSRRRESVLEIPSQSKNISMSFFREIKKMFFKYIPILTNSNILIADILLYYTCSQLPRVLSEYASQLKVNSKFVFTISSTTPCRNRWQNHKPPLIRFADPDSVFFFFSRVGFRPISFSKVGPGFVFYTRGSDPDFFIEDRIRIRFFLEIYGVKIIVTKTKIICKDPVHKYRWRYRKTVYGPVMIFIIEGSLEQAAKV